MTERLRLTPYRRNGLYQGHKRAHQIWNNMRHRCLNPKNPSYDNYGRKGVTVCDRWMSFENFLEDMGDPPSAEHSLDRRRNEAGYEPTNCRWVLKEEQRRNQSTNIYIEVESIKLLALHWSEVMGLKRGCLYYRLKQGWSELEAVTTPNAGRRGVYALSELQRADAIRRAEQNMSRKI